MVEPTMPIGATIAGFIMAVISWYGMLRTGVQLVHDDIESRKSVVNDIWNMLVDLKHQENSFDDWKRTWRISEQTPNAVLLQFWSARRLNIINEKFKRINSDLEKARKKLGPLAEIRNGDWEGMSKARRKYYTESFIWFKKKFVQELIESCPKNMAVIKEESEAGWHDQQEILSREIAHITPYHVQVAHLLVQIAKQNLNDAEALRTCCQVVRDDITIFLDLDLFNAFAAVTEDQHIERIEQILQAGHLKVELLLREANRQGAELSRVVVERVFNGASPESRIVDAFRAILGTSDRTHYFTSNASTLFCLSKCRRAEVPCSTLQKSFREVLADHDPPTYNAPDEKFLDHEIVLGKLSNARAAFELAQSCLLFLRTSWIQGLCRCTVRCGVLSEVPAGNEHQFGLELVETTHQPPSLRDPYQPGSYVDGSSEHSWCMKNYHWYGLNKSIRRLGLLLVELFLSTIVLPETNDDIDGAAPVAQIYISVKAQPGPWKWELISLKTVLKLVKQSFKDSEHLAVAVEHCLTGSFPSSPSDGEMEKHLRMFYFRTVKPDIYEIQLRSVLPSS